MGGESQGSTEKSWGGGPDWFPAAQEFAQRHTSSFEPAALLRLVVQGVLSCILWDVSSVNVGGLAFFSGSLRVNSQRLQGFYDVAGIQKPN